MENYLTCGQAARKLRVSISTLKRWINDPGLTMNTLRNHSGWRLFSEDQVRLLREFQKEMKRNGKRFNQATLMPMNAGVEEGAVQKKRLYADVKSAAAL